MTKHPEPFVILSYPSKDTEMVEEIYDRLKQSGVRPWMFSRDIHPGEPIEKKTKEAIDAADFFLVCLSKHPVTGKRPSSEISLALRLAKQKGDVFIIPLRLEEVPSPKELEQFRWIDLFRSDGFSKLVGTLGGSDEYTLPVPDVPEELLEACRTGNCVLYAGAGIAAEAGFPTWKPFLEELVNWVIRKEYLDDDYGQSLKVMAQQGQLDIIADNVVSIVRDKNVEQELIEFLQQTFVDPPISLQEAHRHLSYIPFSAVLTTNFDVLLERIFADRNPKIFTPYDTEELFTCYSKNNFFILKLYGAVDRPETLLISRAEFEDTITSNISFTQFMETLFFNRTMLFLGASIAGIETYLESIRFHSRSKNHFALVQVQDETYKVEASRLARRFGIQVIPFTTRGSYEAVLKFVQVLSGVTDTNLEAALRAKEPVSVKRTVTPKAYLKRILLENIGPFDSLELELEKTWNILLGDNGVGKSSILKAIALGIGGEDTQLYAERLIKSGHTDAAITLETNTGKTYFTQIFRATNAPTRVVTRGSRLLEGEGWLTLGFPPLRSMSWERLSGPQLEEGKRRPIPMDVLPLVIGEPDPRCNNLKQWIMNLDYRSAKQANMNERQTRHYHDMLQHFFEIVGILVEGVKIEFGKVDVDQGKIIIHTSDGNVPIEALSQGTISLIGWVGVLLQRMYEVFENEHKVLNQYALVLIDEIDAHMHPGWQQKLVPHLKQIFPNVQFIATTHSPLITLMSEPGETLLVQRQGPEQDRIVVQRSQLDVRRWRADQVLTTLFGLDSSNPTLHEWVSEYTELLAKDSLDQEERKRLNYLSNVLDIAPPEPFEREEARIAYRLIEKALEEKITAIPPEQQEAIRREAKVQVIESVTQRRRPL